MTKIADIYQGGQQLIKSILVQEMKAQGHHLTGAMEESIEASISKVGKADVMDGFSAYYTQFVDQGVPASSASFRQFPFLVNYFLQRGLGEKEAKGAAAATIHVWMKEGMSTQASKRFSETGSRQNMIENAFVGAEFKIDEYLTNGFDFVVEEKFQVEKSETI